MSPKYTTSARGSLFRTSNKTESPPDPESNIPNIAKVYPRYANLVLMPEYSGIKTRLAYRGYTLAMLGMFDSGSGGLSVLLEVRKRLPRADVVYLGDIKNAPYGGPNQG